MSKPRLLVIVASHEGQTRKIAERLVAQATGYAIDWHDLHQGVPETLAGYERILVGASIRYGHFHPNLQRLVQRHHATLSAQQAAFFSVSLTARKPEKATPATHPYTRKFFRAAPWQPQQQAVFAGALLYSRYTWWQRRIIQFIMLLTGGSRDTSRDLELTDWQRVAQFAAQLFPA